MKTPKHIMDTALMLKEVCDKNNIYQTKINEIIKRLENDVEVLEIPKIIKQMQKLADLLQVDVKDFDATTVFKQVKVQEGLEADLEKAKSRNPENKAEIEELENFIKEASLFKYGWLKGDEMDEIREFKIIKTQKEWEEILNSRRERSCLRELTSILDFKLVEVVYVSDGNVENVDFKLANRIIDQVGDKKFANKYDQYRIWLNHLGRATYYIYIPK